LGRERQEPAAGVSAAVEAAYGARAEVGAREALRKQVEGGLRRALGALQRQREEAERHLADLDGAEQWRGGGGPRAGAGRRATRPAARLGAPPGPCRRASGSAAITSRAGKSSGGRTLPRTTTSPRAWPARTTSGCTLAPSPAPMSSSAASSAARPSRAPSW